MFPDKLTKDFQVDAYKRIRFKLDPFQLKFKFRQLKFKILKTAEFPSRVYSCNYCVI